MENINQSNSNNINLIKKVNVHVSSHAICWGIDLALKKIAEDAKENGIEASHRWAHSEAAIKWDPLEFVKRKDERMLKMYPGLNNVKVLKNISDTQTGKVAIGHHGTEEDYKKTAPTADVIDYTCPFIARSDKQASNIADAGFDLVIFGKKGNHHCEFAKSEVEKRGRKAIICENVDDVIDELLVAGRKWACQGQVTANVAVWQKFKNDLSNLSVPVKIINTVCPDSSTRQDEAIELAKKCDVVIVVNDNGGSTLSVFENCVLVNPKTYRYDPLNEQILNIEWFKDAKEVGVVGGIHVPEWVMQDVAKNIEQMCNTMGSIQ